jgi:uncharacterized tellurite resistance protein B-like protein
MANPETAATAAAATAAPRRLQGLTWVGTHEMVVVSGVEIAAAMTYLADTRKADNPEPAAIDVALPVARVAVHSGARELGYWPQYTSLTAEQRRTYLQWLASGRRKAPPELGYTFLFIYGLERRALVESSDQAAVFDEVLRLRGMYATGDLPVSRSFDSYTSCFLWFLATAYANVLGLARIERLARETTWWTEEALAALLAWFAESGTPVPAWAAFAVAESLPLSQRSVVVKRVAGEFRELFERKYDAQFPEGLRLRWSKNPWVHRYRPASAALARVEVRLPNVLGVPSQFKALSEIWNVSVADLRRLSSAVARGEQAANTPAAWEALPPELRSDMDHPCCDAMQELVVRETREDGRMFVGAIKLAAVLGIEATEKLTQAQARRLCETASHTGYCVEPDARMTGKGYRGDEVVALFLRMTDEEPEQARYAAAACMLRAGMAMAKADGTVDASETALLMQQIRQAFELAEDEVRRLEALRGLLEHRPPDLTSLGRLTKGMSLEQRQSIGRLMLAVIAADGVITDDELRAFRKAYQAMDLGKAAADAAIASLSQPAGVDEPPTVRPASYELSAGESIPPAPVEQKGLRLNRAAIASIMDDTREVAAMLAEAMRAESDEAPAAALHRAAPDPGPASAAGARGPAQVQADVVECMAEPEITVTSDPTLPARYAAFCQLLLARADWPMADAEATARQHGHMLNGAIEALNDWSFEKYGGQLFVEDGERLLIERQLLSN